MILKRFEENPILKPNKDHSWEARAVFNGCPTQYKNKIFLLYRAVSLSHYYTIANTRLAVSNIGIAESKDGLHFSKRRRFIIPEQEWEKFGCEDPRITKLGGKYYIFYTALSNWPPNANSIKVGLAITDDLKEVKEKHLVTPFNAKAMALFPEKIKGKIWAILTVNTDRPPAKICVASFNKESDIWSEKYWQKWYQKNEQYSLHLQRSPNDQIEVGAQPIKTKYGWLIIYSYIRGYFSYQRVFTVEAVLLDLENPSKVIGKTSFPILSPEEYYEKYGIVPKIVFPSGALLKKKKLFIYYGSADTTCSVAFTDIDILVNKFIKKTEPLVKFKRANNNPIIKPNENNLWEAKATFNPAAIYLNGKVRILYRAMSNDNTSVIGYAESSDFIHIDYRSNKPVYVPRESFEQKLQPGSNSGCEDPRIVKIGSKIYMFYTAFDGINPPRVALTSISVDDFLNKKWNWKSPILISPPHIDDKDASMFPERINGKYIIIHRSGEDIDLSFNNDFNFDNGKWLDEYRWIMPRKGWWDSKKVGACAPPIKTKKGWVLFYHGISEEDNCYRVGAVLVNLEDPTKIISRLDYPLFEPEKNYEKEGWCKNVVFPCGAILVKNQIIVYYGGGDKVLGAASVNLKELLDAFKSCEYKF